MIYRMIFLNFYHFLFLFHKRQLILFLKSTKNLHIQVFYFIKLHQMLISLIYLLMVIFLFYMLMKINIFNSFSPTISLLFNQFKIPFFNLLNFISSRNFIKKFNYLIINSLNFVRAFNFQPKRQKNYLLRSKNILIGKITQHHQIYLIKPI